MVRTGHSLVMALGLGLWGGGASAEGALEYFGVNLSGAEFGVNNPGGLPGVYGQDYLYPGLGSVADFAGKGFNTVRLPFRWERLQPTLGGNFDVDEFDRLDQFVGLATGMGVNVILDVHNFGTYFDSVIGAGYDPLDPVVPQADFGNLWSRLADQYKDNDRVIFGLMNEPMGINEDLGMETENWLLSANTAIAAIRGTGAENLVLVPGNGFSGAWSWTSPPGNFYGTPNGQVMGGVVDPADNFAFEVHQYFDADSSGTGHTVSATIGAERLVDFTGWLRDNGFRGFLGEFGAPPDALSLTALDLMLDYVDLNQDVWMGWTYWSAGEWWPADYPLSVAAGAASGRPQLAILEAHLDPVPEPGAGVMVALALAGWWVWRRATRNASQAAARRSSPITPGSGTTVA